MNSGDRCFSAAKLSFAYGLANALCLPLALGATTILYPARSTPQEVFEVLRKRRPTIFFSVPSNYQALLNYANTVEQGFDLSSLRIAVSAGEALPASLFLGFKRRFGLDILDAVGSTEAFHMFIANRPGSARPGSSGQRIAGCELRIVNEREEPVQEGDIGDLLVKSESACAGYWHHREKSRQTFVGEWLRTGDKYREDADGYFWHEGRSDDMFKVNGKWINPAEIEQALCSHPLVSQAIVVGLRDLSDLIKPVAYVVLTPGAEASSSLAKELEQMLSSKLPFFKRPRRIEFVNSLPSTPSGKVQRYRLRQDRLVDSPGQEISDPIGVASLENALGAALGDRTTADSAG